MKALVLKEYNQFVMEDVPRLEVPPGHVLIRVRACGICGSDVHGMDGSTGRRIPPIIMGHEASGEIAEIALGVTGWAVGDRVTFDSTISCGQCSFCRRGQVNLCDNRRVLGVSCGDYRQNGAFAEYVAVPAQILYRISDEISFEQAAMVEAVSVAVHAVKRTPLELNATAVVVGSGMIGLLVVQALRAAGCGQVIAMDLDEGRLELARRLGATHTLRADDPTAVERIIALSGGAGADAGFEVVGIAPSIKTTIDCVRKGGSVTLVGNLSPQVELPLQSVVTRELTLYGSCASAGEYPLCLELIANGKINVTEFISAVAPLEEGPSWFARLHSGESGLMKVILKP
jgi:L-iditol 2-dehydrogenase